MASWLFSSIQSISSKVLEAIGGTCPGLQYAASPVADQNESVVADLEKLSRMLARIMAVQQDAEEREIHDRSVRLWLEELRGVAYQAEDVLDEYHYEVLRSTAESGDAAIQMHHEDRGIKRKFNELCTPSSLASSSITTKISIPEGMGEKIKRITERFEEISNFRRDLHLREADGTQLITGPQIRPPTSSHVDERAIFGRKEEKEKILELLNTSSDTDFMVLPIVGAGGFGKTTLAQLVYNDSRIPQLFDKRCWVSVSEDFDLVRLTKAVIESISDKPCHFSELSKLQDVLNQNIRGISLFLVLDDVWNDKKQLWECFRGGFIGAKSVRILTTTRNTSVAEIMQTTSPFHLGFLPEENCWSLFKRFAFGNREACEDANLFEIGRGIVEKCKGSPLAIKALGGILRYEMDVEKWREVLESNISEIDEAGEIMPALWLSYSKLRLHLRPCFLYLSMFPKGIPFEKGIVVRLWIAQGYINGNTGNLKTLEEIGSEYFDELQGRSLIDQPNGFATGAIRTIANLDGTSPFFEYGIFSKISCVRALHLMYYVSLDTLGMLKHLRYIHVTDYGTLRLPKSLCLLYHLQTLDLRCYNLQELPKNMKNLVQLRYIQLTSKKIKQIPESIFQLQKLHTLSLAGCDELKELPRGIEQLTRLRVLDLPKSLIHMPHGIGTLTTLKPLSGRFDVTDHSMMGGLGELKDMNQISGLLCISGLKNISDVDCCRKANLASKLNLNMLILDFEEAGHVGSFIWEHQDTQKLHLFVKSSNATKKVTFEYCLELKFLSIPSGIKKLKIHECGFHEIIFPSVSENLTISNCLELISVNWIDVHLSSIYEVTFECCPKLVHPTIPTRIKRLKIHECNFQEIVLPKIHDLNFREIMFPSRSETLIISNCRELISINWSNRGLNYFEEVNFECCPELELLTIPSGIKKLKIQECGFREIIFSSISEKLTISNCPELLSVTWLDEHFSSTNEVTYERCPKLVLPTIPRQIKKLKVSYCGVQEIIFPFQSRIQMVDVSHCTELVSIRWARRDTSFHVGAKFLLNDSPELKERLENLQISCCSILHFPVSVLHLKTKRAEIYDCPRMELGRRYFYQRDTEVKVLNAFGNKEIYLPHASVDSIIPLLESSLALLFTKEEFKDGEPLTCPPLVGPNCQCIMLNLSSLVILEISRCRKVISVTGLDNLSKLMRLSISGCPELCDWKDRRLPIALKFLELECCDKLQSVPSLSVENQPSFLKTLVIINCSMLSVLEGFNGLMNLKKVDILSCRNICVSPAAESLNFRPHATITIGDCPLLKDWSHRNSIAYYELKDCSERSITDNVHGIRSHTNFNIAQTEGADSS
ncbi:Disease resistance protein RGA2 [Rhynchospora pubera]|uniref:Disease resistance protein RGA2 n=1 Tax=Rhynchospora pubera TaxID=906938 RepID=A0AAV8H1G6_9POAL|nr:Disease resistance protein RGA2 [Rhynchospora pubera]